MCGIVGMIAKRVGGFFSPDTDMFEQLLLLDYLRGTNSTGAFGVHNNGQLSLIKIASHPLDLFACKDWQDGFRRKHSVSMHMAIGHNRRATGGKLISENAHPFVEGNIVLVHNGVIHEGVSTQAKEIEVDSHMVCEAFAQSHYADVVKELRGAFAFVWYDTDTKTLHTLRNDDRPLSIVETDETAYLASEPWMVIALLGRQGKKALSVTSTEPGNLYSFKKGGAYTVEPVELAKPKVYPVVSHISSEEALDRTRPPYPSRYSSNEFYKKLNAPKDGRSPPIEGQEVIFKVVRIVQLQPRNSGITQLHKVYGKVISSAHQQNDCMFETSDIEQFENEEILQGTIHYITYMCNGTTLELKSIKDVVQIALFQSKIPLIEWRFLINNARCKECDTTITWSGSERTRVRFNKTDEKWVCFCPECVKKKIQSPAILEAFLKDAANESANDSTQPGVERAELTVDAISGAVIETSRQMH